MVLLVEVVDQKISKPFLGGWRHKITEVEYLNGNTQTGPPSKKLQQQDKCSRMVQTAEIKDASTQSSCNRATQMYRPDYYISSESDKFLLAQPYETFEEMSLRLDFDGNANKIQKNYRAYRIHKFIEESAEKYRELRENCIKYEEEKIIMYKNRHHREILGKLYPKSREDFNMLYELIEKWRLDRIENTKPYLFRAARCAENCSILEKTVEMLNIVDQKRQGILNKYKQKRCAQFLKTNCIPIEWIGYKGRRVEMITMKNQRAREFKSIYDSLANRNATREERMETLITLKKSLDAHNCIKALELIYMLEQEFALLSRGIEQTQLNYLRGRLIIKFLYFVRVSNECGCKSTREDVAIRESFESISKICKCCLKLLPFFKFAINGRMKKLSICKGCIWLFERNIGRANYNPYEFLLNRVRADERRLECFSAIAFLMQKNDMFHLVNNIWHGHSIVGKNDDIYALRMIRYDKNQDWSPWNCILLTEEEAEIHYKIKDLTTVYSKYLLEKISMTHLIARNHFKNLSSYEKVFRESCHFYSIQDGKEYKPPNKWNDYYFI